MQLYPSIDNIPTSARIIAFDKLDGSNIRAEWTRKSGFSKFGTRRRLLDESHGMLGESIGLFQEKYSDDLTGIFRKSRFEKATVFFEFYGENSFAGFHEDELHEVKIFDIHVHKKGLLPARDFLKLVEDKVDHAPVLYRGVANSQFIESVHESTLEGMSLEGVVCKAGLDNRGRPMNFKLKSKAWLDRLKEKYSDDDAMFEKLK